MVDKYIFSKDNLGSQSAASTQVLYDNTFNTGFVGNQPCGNTASGPCGELCAEIFAAPAQFYPGGVSFVPFPQYTFYQNLFFQVVSADLLQVVFVLMADLLATPGKLDNPCCLLVCF